MLLALIAGLAFQPSPAMLRQLFEDSLSQHRSEYGDADARTAQSARDLGLFLSRQGEAPAAHDALTEAVRIDQKAFGAEDRRTLADVAELAAVSTPAESLWRQAAKSPDPAIAAKSLAALGTLREQSGDRAGAAAFYRQALAKEPTNAARLNTLSLVVAPAEAITLLERALRLSTKTRSIETATIEMNLAARLLNKSRSARLAKEAAATLEEILGPEHPRTKLARQLEQATSKLSQSFR